MQAARHDDDDDDENIFGFKPIPNDTEFKVKEKSSEKMFI